MIHTLSFVVGP